MESGSGDNKAIHALENQRRIAKSVGNIYQLQNCTKKNIKKNIIMQNYYLPAFKFTVNVV